MKVYVLLPLACLAGIVIGAWGPREELRALKELPREEKAKAQKSATGFESFARLANIPAEARRPGRRKKRKAPLFAAATNHVAAAYSAADTNHVAKAPTTNAAKPEPSAADGETAAANPPPRETEAPSPEDLRARIEEAQDLWRTRVDLVRAQWKSKLGLDDATSKKFDAAIDDMNGQLYDTMAAVAERLAKQDDMTPELGLKMVGDVTTVMAETYDKLGACVPPERRDEISEIQVFEFIDPGVAEPLIAVEDKLSSSPVRGGGAPK